MTTYTSQPDDTTGVDSYIDGNAATSNRSTENIMYIGRNNSNSSITRALIKFDLSSIPSNAVISSATLSITVSAEAANTQDDTMSVYRILKNWVEAQVTWNIYSTGNNWATAGLGSGTDYDATAIGSAAKGAVLVNGNVLDFSLDTSVIRLMIDGTYSNYGFFLKIDSEGNDAVAYHSSGSATASYRPKLVIEYIVSGRSSQAVAFF